MMEIIKKDMELEQIKKQTSEIISYIKQTENKDEIKNALDKMQLAREMAKIQKRTEELYVHLLRIEIECFKKIVELDMLDVLGNMQRKPAVWWSTQSDNQIEYLIEKYHGRSARQVYLQKNRDDDREKGIKTGTEIAQNKWLETVDSEYIDECSKSDVELFTKSYSRDVNAAVSILLDEYASGGTSFTIEEMADKVLLDNFTDSEGIGELDAGIKEGIREVCRRAIRGSKSFFAMGKKTPKFITCGSHEKNSTISWMRIPFENATLAQFNEMIELRKLKLEQDKKALDNLIEIYNELAKESKSENDIIGNLIADEVTEPCNT